MKIFFASMDEVPEHLRDQVKQEGDQIFLEGEGATGILTKNKELLQKNTEYKKVYDKFKSLGDNVKPEDVQKALADMANAEHREAELQRRIAEAIQENNKGWQIKLDNSTKEATGLRSALEEQLIDNALTSAITDAKGDSFFVLPGLRPSVKVVLENGKYVTKVVGPDGKPRLNTQSGEPMSIVDLVSEAKADKKYAKVFEAPAASGSGAAGDAGKNNNGGSKGTVKLTRDQATNARTFQEALKSVDNDMSRIEYTD